MEGWKDGGVAGGGVDGGVEGVQGVEGWSLVFKYKIHNFLNSTSIHSAPSLTHHCSILKLLDKTSQRLRVV